MLQSLGIEANGDVTGALGGAKNALKYDLDLIKPYQEYVTMTVHVYGFWRDLTNFESSNKTEVIGNVIFSSLRLLLTYFEIEDAVMFMSTMFKGLPPNCLLEAQSGIPREFIDSWDTLANGDLAKKLTRVLVGLITCPLTKSFGLKFTETGFDNFIDLRASKIKFTTAPELVRSTLDLIVSFGATGYECFVEKSLRPALVRDRAARDWLRDFESVMDELADKPVDANFSPARIIESMNNLSARGANLLVSYPREIGPCWKILMDKRTRLRQEYNIASSRKPPFSVLVYGTPGIGKSAVVQTIATIYQRAMVMKGIYPELKWDPAVNMYTFNVKDDFWSGYKGAVQWCVLLDDIGREHVNHVAAGKMTSINEIIDICNTIGIATNQADLPDKGVIPLIPKLVLATTNTKDLNAHHAVAESSAVLRRFPIVVQPILKAEFLDANTGMMKKLDRVVHDAWDFRVETVKLTIRGELGCEKVITTRHIVQGSDGSDLMTGADLSAFLVAEAVKHEQASTVMLESNKVDPSICMCEHGVLSHFICKQCTLEPQAWTNPFVRKKTFSERMKNKFLHFAIDYLPIETYMKTILQDYTFRDHIRVAETRLGLRIPQRTQRARDAVMIFGSCTLSAVVITALVKYFRKNDRLESQSSKNIWALLSSNNVDFSLPKVHKKDNLQELLSSVRKGSFRLAVKAGDKAQEVTAFSFKDGWYVTVSHVFLTGDKWSCVASYPCGKNYSLKSQCPFTLSRKSIKFLPNDLVMFECANLLPRKFLYNFLPKTIDRAGRNFKIYDPRLDILGEGMSVNYGALQYLADDGSLITGSFMNATRTDRNPLRGDCGNIVISQSFDGYYISGIHCAGTANNSSSRMIITQVSQQLLDSAPPLLAMSEYVDFDIIKHGSKKSGPLQTPHPTKGVQHWVNGYAIPLGSYKARTSMQSRVKKSIIHDDIVQEFGFVNKLTKPLMIPEERDGVWLNPFSVATVDQANITPLFDVNDIIACAQSYIQDVTKDTEWLLDCGPVDIRTAVNGIHGDSFLNILPMSTSGGMFFAGAKKQYFDVCLDDDGVEFYMPNEEVQSMLDLLIRKYSLGQRACVLFNGTLKDEPIKQSKRDSGKTRIFTACDVAFSILVRQKYLKVTKAIMKYNFKSECAVGMNCYSKDWEKLKHYLCRFGDDRLIAGDYSAYDKNMPAAFIRTDFWILDSLIAVHTKLSPQDILIMRGIATDIAFPIINMNGDVIQFLGGNPSGTPLTVIINSLTNSIYLRFAFLKIEGPKSLPYFKDNVTPMTLGDDNCLGSALDSYNHTAISNVLSAHGIPYTMADKESVSVPFININEVDFLKRNFRSVDGRIVGQLSESSIFKSLTMYVDKGNISHEEQLAQSYLAARREWSLYGKDFFDHHCGIMAKILSNYSGVTRFFIPQHHLSYENTMNWVREE